MKLRHIEKSYSIIFLMLNSRKLLSNDLMASSGFTHLGSQEGWWGLVSWVVQFLTQQVDTWASTSVPSKFLISSFLFLCFFPLTILHFSFLCLWRVKEASTCQRELSGLDNSSFLPKAALEWLRCGPSGGWGRERCWQKWNGVLEDTEIHPCLGDDLHKLQFSHLYIGNKKC